jgi:hypothetical protein
VTGQWCSASRRQGGRRGKEGKGGGGRQSCPLIAGTGWRAGRAAGGGQCAIVLRPAGGWPARSTQLIRGRSSAVVRLPSAPCEIQSFAFRGPSRPLAHAAALPSGQSVIFACDSVVKVLSTVLLNAVGVLRPVLGERDDFAAVRRCMRWNMPCAPLQTPNRGGARPAREFASCSRARACWSRNGAPIA